MERKEIEGILGPWTYMSVRWESDEDGFCLDDRESTEFLMYHNGLHIILEEDHYYLVIGYSEWISEDLCELEAILAQYSRDEGCADWIAEYRGADYGDDEEE